MKKSVLIVAIIAVLMLSACGRRNKAQNPLADVGSVQPDKVLFDRAMDALQRRKYDVSRLTFQTLINTYPDSEYIARAKLGVADSWYEEGTTSALAQAEAEYKDFITFFPTMAEAAEAQLKVAGIHYKQMHKPDRDFTHAKRAEDEYRQMIQQFPESTLVPQAKQRLREVQEVLAEREFRIGRFYYMRQSFAAAEARLKSLADQYPLYSNAEEALWLLGQSYEDHVKFLKALPGGNSPLAEKLMGEMHKRAADAYGRIITRYPATARADSARERLQALSFPVPEPTAEAIARSKEEEAGGKETGMMARVWGNFKGAPNVDAAARTGEPPLEDVQPTNATQIVRDLGNVVMNEAGKSTATIEAVKPGEIPNEAPPRSDAGGSTPPSTHPAEPNQEGPGPDAKPAQAPEQVNEAATDPAAAKAAEPKKDDKQESTSKKKRKKKLGIF